MTGTLQLIFSYAALSVVITTSSLPNAFGAVGLHVGSADNIEGVQTGPCTPTDCEILREDGSRWTVFGTMVTRQRYLRPEAGTRLPFGLYRISEKEDALSAVRSSTGINLVRSNNISSYYGLFRLPDGTEAILYLEFDDNGLVMEIGVTVGETG